MASAKNDVKKEAKKEDGIKELIERAQETLHEAELNVLKAFKDLSERVQATQAEARKKVDEVLENWPAKAVFDKLTDRAEIEAKVSGLRDGFETRFEEGTEAFWSRLGLATKADVQDVSRKLVTLSKRVKELESAGPKRRTRAEA